MARSGEAGAQRVRLQAYLEYRWLGPADEPGWLDLVSEPVILELGPNLGQVCVFKTTKRAWRLSSVGLLALLRDRGMVPEVPVPEVPALGMLLHATASFRSNSCDLR